MTNWDAAVVRPGRPASPFKSWTWKVVVADPGDHLLMEYRAKARTIQEIVSRYPHAIEIKRMKR